MSTENRSQRWIPEPVVDWVGTDAPDPRDAYTTRINGHVIGVHSNEESARNHAWRIEAYIRDGSTQPVDTSGGLMSTSIRISDDGRSVTVLELADGGYGIEWMRLDGDVEVINRVAVSPEALVATVVAARAMLGKRGIIVT